MLLKNSLQLYCGKFKVKELRKCILCKHQSKESWNGYINIKKKRVNSRAKEITMEKEVHYTILKGSIGKEDITILSVSAHNSKLKYMKHLP